MRPARHGWVRHRLIIENTSARPLYLDHHREAAFLEGRQILAADDLCGYVRNGRRGRVRPGCRLAFAPTTVAPGQRATEWITLWRGLRGMPPVTRDRFTFSKSLRFRFTTPFEARDDGPARTASLVLTYRVSG